MSEISGPLAFLQTLAKKEEGHILTIRGATDSQVQVHLLTILMKFLRREVLPYTRVIIVVPSQRDLLKWDEYLETNASGLGIEPGGFERYQLPSVSYWGKERFANHNLAEIHRVECLSRWSDTRVVLTTLSGLAQKTLKPEIWNVNTLRILKDESYEFEDILSRLEELGYRSAITVSERGAYAVRGGILDIFPAGSHHPARLEFLGDILSDIRIFDPETQKSLYQTDALHIGLTREVVISAKLRDRHAQIIHEYLLETQIGASDRTGMLEAFNLGHLFPGFPLLMPLLREADAGGIEYIKSDDLLVFPVSRSKCLLTYQTQMEEQEREYQTDLMARRPTLAPDRHYVSATQLTDWVLSHQNAVDFDNLASPDRPSTFNIRADGLPPGVTAPKAGEQSFGEWIKIIEELINQHSCRVVLLCSRVAQIDRAATLLDHYGLGYKRVMSYVKELAVSTLKGAGISIAQGYIQSPVWISESEILLIPEHIFFGERQINRKTAKKIKAQFLPSFNEIQIGSLLVHVQHGVGRYHGMKNMLVGGHEAEFVELEYAGGDKLYLPVDKLNLLQRFSASNRDNHGHSLDKLRGSSWDRKQTRVRKAVRDIADKLLRIYAERKLTSRDPYANPSEIFHQFEAGFPYIETDDQLRAIDDVNEDFKKSHPMDRLVCGDVGFGKTEVALRAAMRAVLNGSQVMILTPTTILCYQHYRTFLGRLGEFGVSVGQANRFVPAPEIKENLARFKAGKLDILVGTHRILSRDIEPRNLGLVIIDEEQRFGVAHKEYLKELRAGVDILTLTATPIPRSLHMATLGIKDISLIATPPRERLAIKTYISPFDQEIIRSAIEQELARGGQVFFVHNRVEDIDRVCSFINELVPESRARVGHGQMEERQLEKVIIDFIEQKFPVLVCTTIIESGVDMPNVNTLIVNNADRFGLAQLYQMRGRVGRSSRQSFAYFLMPEHQRITSDAWKRLEILSTHQELGAGFQIASYDLEIRGAGSLLGADQSGHISEVGYEHFMEMLETAVREAMGKPKKAVTDIEIKIPISAQIPKKYISDDTLRLQVYKSFFSAETLEEITRLQVDLKDRYGEIPKPAENIIKIARLKCILSALDATSIAVVSGGYCELKFKEMTKERHRSLSELVAKRRDSFQWGDRDRLFVNITEVDFHRLGQDAAVQVRLVDGLITKLRPLLEGIVE